MLLYSRLRTSPGVLFPGSGCGSDAFPSVLARQARLRQHLPLPHVSGERRRPHAGPVLVPNATGHRGRPARARRRGDSRHRDVEPRPDLRLGGDPESEAACGPAGPRRRGTRAAPVAPPGARGLGWKRRRAGRRGGYAGAVAAGARGGVPGVRCGSGGVGGRRRGFGRCVRRNHGRAGREAGPPPAQTPAAGRERRGRPFRPGAGRGGAIATGRAGFRSRVSRSPAVVVPAAESPGWPSNG